MEGQAGVKRHGSGLESSTSVPLGKSSLYQVSFFSFENEKNCTVFLIGTLRERTGLFKNAPYNTVRHSAWKDEEFGVRKM